MKTLRHFCAVAVLTFAFTLSVSADGIISTEKAAPPPPVTANGVISTGKTGTTADSVTQIALNLLQSVIALF
ncbi:MAG: hypothetical protein ACR2G4_12870 [Pyrinomonadaceae bacterium]